MSASTPLLGTILASFFNDYLKIQRGLRPNSITSYADAMRLLLQFAAVTGKKKVTPAWPRRSSCRRSVPVLELPRREPKQCGPVPQPAIGGSPHVLRIHRPAIPGEAWAGSESSLHSEKAHSTSGDDLS